MEGNDGNYPFAPPVRQRLSEDVFSQIKEAILSGAYKPGQRLPSEKAFCERFKVGRAVVREAHRKLESSGLIHVRPGSGGGVFVTAPDHSTLVDTFEVMVRLQDVSLQELTTVRVAVEMAAFRLMVQKVDEVGLERLQRSIDEAREALEQGVTEPRNIAFHLVIADIAENRLLTGIIDAIVQLSKRLHSLYKYSYDRKKTFLEDHQHVVDLLREKRYADAERAHERHIVNSIRWFS